MKLSELRNVLVGLKLFLLTNHSRNRFLLVRRNIGGGGYKMQHPLSLHNVRLNNGKAL